MRSKQSHRELLKNSVVNTLRRFHAAPSHSREGGKPEKPTDYWMPVFTGMTNPTPVLLPVPGKSLHLPACRAHVDMCRAQNVK